MGHIFKIGGENGLDGRPPPRTPVGPQAAAGIGRGATSDIYFFIFVQCTCGFHMLNIPAGLVSQSQMCSE